MKIMNAAPPHHAPDTALMDRSEWIDKQTHNLDMPLYTGRQTPRRTPADRWLTPNENLSDYVVHHKRVTVCAPKMAGDAGGGHDEAAEADHSQSRAITARTSCYFT